jgi:N-acyl-L-homoserine lactone synthetase
MTDQLTRAQQAPGDAAMRAMFAARKRVFVDMLHWDLPVLEDMYEIDQFDTPSAEYLILLGGAGEHRASARLLPTIGPHLLGNLYSWLCDEAVPRGPTIWEISRFCVDPAQTASERRAARDELVTAIADYALRHDISDYTGVAEWNWFQKIMRFGWSCRPLGNAADEGASKLVALRIRIDADTKAGLERAGTWVPLGLVDYESGETAQ